MSPWSLCVINYNGERYLEATLAAAAGQQPPPDELLVVDNGSTDDSLALARRLCPAARIIALPHNAGPAAARNAALAATHPRVLFVDNDVVLAPDCAARLHDALDRHPRAAAVMPRVVDAAAPDTIWCDGAESHFLGVVRLRNSGRPRGSVPPETVAVGSLISACFLLDRQRWTAPDLFDESFFIYLEDHDCGLRIRAAGLDLLACGEAECRHGEGTAGWSLRLDGRYTTRRVACLIRNRWQVILKHCTAGTLIRLAPMLAVYECFQAVAVLKKGWIGPWLDAARWMVRHRGELTAKRRVLQRERRRPDRELFGNGPLPFAPQLATSRVERAGIRVLDALAVGYWRLQGGL